MSEKSNNCAAQFQGLANKMKLTQLFFTGLCLLLTTPLYAAWEQPTLGHELTALPKPVAAPGFNLRDMDDEPHSFADYRGKVILLNFWATWCPPCRREMPSMERLYQRMQNRSFVVLAINQMESPDHVFAYTGQLEVVPNFTILFDINSEVSQAYRVNGLPTSYLIDKKGNIRYRAIGGREFDHPNVEQLINTLMNEHE
jgi:thiol-disulfide isomerase/thioredoxin